LETRVRKEKQPGLFARLRNALFGKPEPTWVGDSEVHLQRDGQQFIAVPSDGDVFPFWVRYRMTWSARGLSQSELDNLSNLYSDSVRRSFFDKIWPIGRNYFPHDNAAAEQAMNEQLTDWCYIQGAVRCQVQVTVQLDERVKEIQQPLWEEMTVQDLRHRLERRRVDRVDDLLRHWSELIERFGTSPTPNPTVVFAANLVDKEFAAILGGLSNQRQENAKHLIEVLRKASDIHQHVGLFEFAGAYDAALRSFEKQAGLTHGSVTPISVPPEESPSNSKAN
jgi:hypothetical protein